MAYIYENDISKTRKNIQTTVAQLVSLHKAEYEWNMLGIKVVGHIDALPIPEGEYDYGDAYMVGTETPYDMYIYTRADEYHTSDYWFDVGKFPQPGPQGPRGTGFDSVSDENDTPDAVIYDTTNGMTIQGSREYTYSEDGELKTHQTHYETEIPIKAGKYISMDATSDNDALEVKVDDTALRLDYFKIDKSERGTLTVPISTENGKQENWAAVAMTPAQSSIVTRNSVGISAFTRVYTVGINSIRGDDAVSTLEIYNNALIDLTVDKTTTETGTLSTSQLTLIQTYKRINVIYDNQVYYRMDPSNAPDGTLNYIHIDCIQDGNGGYRATGKCFSVTVSTRAWQVVDMNFTPAISQYGIRLYTTGTNILFTLQTTASVNDIDPSWLHANLRPTQGTITDSTGTTGCILTPGTVYTDEEPIDVIFAYLPDETSKQFTISQLATSIYQA